MNNPLEEYKSLKRELDKKIKPLKDEIKKITNSFQNKLDNLKKEVEVLKCNEYKELFLSLKKEGIIGGGNIDNFRNNWSYLYIIRDKTQIDLCHRNTPFSVNNDYILIRYRLNDSAIFVKFFDENKIIIENYISYTSKEKIGKELKQIYEVLKRDFDKIKPSAELEKIFKK